MRYLPKGDEKYRQSYRLNVRAEDGSGKTTFTIFHKGLEWLIGVPIEKVIAEIGKVCFF